MPRLKSNLDFTLCEANTNRKGRIGLWTIFRDMWPGRPASRLQAVSKLACLSLPILNLVAELGTIELTTDEGANTRPKRRG